MKSLQTYILQLRSSFVCVIESTTGTSSFVLLYALPYSGLPYFYVVRICHVFWSIRVSFVVGLRVRIYSQF